MSPGICNRLVGGATGVISRVTFLNYATRCITRNAQRRAAHPRTHTETQIKISRNGRVGGFMVQVQFFRFDGPGRTE